MHSISHQNQLYDLALIHEHFWCPKGHLIVTVQPIYTVYMTRQAMKICHMTADLPEEKHNENNSTMMILICIIPLTLVMKWDNYVPGLWKQVLCVCAKTHGSTWLHVQAPSALDDGWALDHPRLISLIIVLGFTYRHNRNRSFNYN